MTADNPHSGTRDPDPPRTPHERTFRPDRERLASQMIDSARKAAQFPARRLGLDADDIEGESLLRWVETGEEADPRWIAKATDYVAKEQNRSRGRYRKHAAAAAHRDDDLSDEWAEEERVYRTLIRRAFDSLSVEQQTVLRLRIFEGHTLEHVGEVLGLSASTVHSHVTKALLALIAQFRPAR